MVWGSVSKNIINPLGTIQERVIKIIFNKDTGNPSHKLCKETIVWFQTVIYLQHSHTPIQKAQVWRVTVLRINKKPEKKLPVYVSKVL